MINTDNKQIRTDLIYADLTYKVRGAIFNVYNELGFGHKEQVYQKALMNELEELQVRHEREVNLRVNYKGKNVGNYRPDFIIEEKIIVEIKAVEFMSKAFEDQLLHYLKTTGFELGLLINFGTPKLYIKRLIWTQHPLKSVSNQRKSYI